MCIECGLNPCDARCPNADEEKAIFNCVICGDSIVDGDFYWDSQDGCICEDCLDEMSRKEILELCGEPLKKAVMEEY